MEEVVKIILISAIAIIATAVKLANEAKKKQQTKQTAANQIDTDNTLSSDLGTQQSQQSFLSGDYITPKKRSKKPIAGNNTPATVSTGGDNSPKTPVNSPKTAPNTILGEDFDLAKAVLYSEILTPKFKNDEF